MAEQKGTWTYSPSIPLILRSGPSAGPLEVGASVSNRRPAELGAGLAAGACGQRLLPHLPHGEQIVHARVLGPLAVVGGVEHHEVAHLVQPGPHAMADAEDEGVRLR